LDPFSIGTYIHTEMIAASLDPFRKTFKHQKTSFPDTISFYNFYRRCIICCCVI